MKDIRRLLSPEEREEYDSLLYEATHDECHKRRPSDEVGPTLHGLLVDAEKAQREWATWVRETAEERGLQQVASNWAKSREVVTTRHGERVVTKAAAYSVRRQGAEKALWWQPTFWLDMEDGDLAQVIADAGKRRSAETDLIAIARRFRRLLAGTGETRVSAGLDVVGMSLDEFLMHDEEVA